LLLVVGAAAFGMWYQQQQATRAAEVAARQATTERDVTAALGEAKLLHEEGLKQTDNPDRWQLTLTLMRSALKRAEEAVERGEPTEALRAEVDSVGTLLEQ